MEFKIEMLEYDILKDGEVMLTKSAPSFLLNTLTDMYCDYLNSPYSMRVHYKNITIDLSSPSDFSYPKL